MTRKFIALALAIVAYSPAKADIAVSANDAHSVLVDGATVAQKDAPADNISVIDLSQSPPRIAATIDVAASVVGPGQGVFVAKDESFAIVACASRIENGTIVPDDRVSVISLGTAPAVLQQVHAGAGADAVAVNPEGTLALVPNRSEGTISIFKLKDKHLETAGKVDLGSSKSAPSGAVFTSDGRNALITRDDGIISVLQIDGDKVQLDPQQVLVGVHPYPIDISPDGKLAAVAHAWGTNGDIGSVTLIDLTAKPFRVVDAVRVPSSSEGTKFTPDGKYLAVSSLNGSNRAPSSPLFNDHAVLTIFAVNGKTLSKTDEAPIGKWSQGIAFSGDGKTLLVQNMVEKNISVFGLLNGKLTPRPPLMIPKGAPATIGTARR